MSLRKVDGGLSKIDLVIVLDASGSVKINNFKKMLDFCKAFLAKADIESGNIQAGILSYSYNAKIEFQIGTFSTTLDIQNAVDGINYSGGTTNTADAIKTMASDMFDTTADRADAPNIGIIITDGKSNVDSGRTIPETQAARGKGIHIYSIGIGLADNTEVFAIATPPSENNSFIIQDFNELSGLDETIFSSICQDVNECASSPCKNGGTCVDKVNAFTCSCPGGFSGDMCEIDIDECADSPCQNGGQCTDKVNEFTCACADGFTGNTCENDIDECEESPCQNGGQCTDKVNGFTCACADGYEGNTCENDIDECEESPCQNGGQCTDKVNGFTCACADGYEGNTCENDIDECEESPCQNGGQCTDKVKGFTCACADGYEGNTCENGKKEKTEREFRTRRRGGLRHYLPSPNIENFTVNDYVAVAYQDNWYPVFPEYWLRPKTASSNSGLEYLTGKNFVVKP
ncbi:fibropellin-1-like [Mytilus trossulus]|uniref:fibropellin-1-like n=1 Tax=Mytilus trossulus TaxID=6551 RepID=UPI003005874C